MEVTKIVSVCLSILFFSHMVIANPILSRDDSVSDLEGDVKNLVNDVITLLTDARRERRRFADDNGRSRRTIGLFNAMGNDVRHHRRPSRRRMHPNMRRSRGGARAVPI